MKHTDQILHGAKADPVLPETLEARRKYFDNIASKLQAIQRLKQDPGYQMFLDELQYEEKVAIDVLETAEDTKLAKAAGVLLAIRSYRTWADDRIAELSDILAAAK